MPTPLAPTLGLRRTGWRRRLVAHHVPLAATSAMLVVLFLILPLFTRSDAHGDISSGPFPKPRTAASRQVGDMEMGNGMGRAGGRARSSVSQAAVATGYVAVVLIGLTLLVGPANLLLRRRNPVSSYLRRDIGAWAAAASVAHVILGVGSYRIGFVDFFLDNGRPRTSSFGFGNWAGLLALVIATGLLAISTDRSLRELRAGPWKRLQRLNYALFALVVLHAFFYGALLRMNSPFTLVLTCTVAAVLAGQALGIRLWRHRHARARPTGSTPSG